MARGVELAGDDPRRQAAVGRQHLVGVDHREGVTEEQDDPRSHSGEGRRQLQVLRHGGLPDPVGGVVPVGPEEVQRMGGIGIDARQPLENGGRDRRWIGQLGERRQDDSGLAKALDARVVRPPIDDFGFESQRRHLRSYASSLILAQSRVACRSASARISSMSAARSRPFAITGSPSTMTWRTAP